MRGSYHPLPTIIYAHQPSHLALQNAVKHALVDHQRADLDELALERATLDERVLLVEVRDELGAVVPPIALRREDEFARLVLGELLALEEDLEGGPDGGRGRERAVHVDRPEGEARADGLVDVDHWRVGGQL